jgi:hypothetical protein
MAPTETSATTKSGRPARRHESTTGSIGSVSRLPDGKSVPSLSRRPVTACRQARPAAPKDPGGT